MLALSALKRVLIACLAIFLLPVLAGGRETPPASDLLPHRGLKIVTSCSSDHSKDVKIRNIMWV
jgi:hypothetical protein